MDTIAIQQIDIDTYNEEMGIKFNEAWGLAQNNIRLTQRHEKAYL